jgi:hypothetical protein
METRLPSSDDFLFGTQPLEGWRIFYWRRPSDAGALFDLAAHAPTGENPYAWARQPRLTSVGGSGSVWVERAATEAVCGNGAVHPAPHKGCGCGLWVLKDKMNAWDHQSRYDASILARVALWGRFVEHSHGWRGEKGYPLELFVVGEGNEHSQQEISERYGVPVGAVQPPYDGLRKFKSMLMHIPLHSFGSAAAFTASGHSLSFTSTGPLVPPPPPPTPPWPSAVVHPSELTKEILKPEGIIPIVLLPPAP